MFVCVHVFDMLVKAVLAMKCLPSHTHIPSIVCWIMQEVPGVSVFTVPLTPPGTLCITLV